MSPKREYALVTGGSRGIGRGIALKLAAEGVKVGLHYFQNETAAKETLAEVRRCGSDGVIIQADVTKVDQVSKLFDRIQNEFGQLDIFVSNARPEAPEFFAPPLTITLDQWNTAFQSQATAFLVGAREAAKFMRDGGRMIAITYARAAGPVACSHGWRWGPQRRRWRPWSDTSRSHSPSGVSPSMPLARAGPKTVCSTRYPPRAQSAIRDWHSRGWTPMRRLGTPADIGNVVALLCREEAGWITAS